MSFPPFKSWQCSFLIKCDFLNLAFKHLHQRAPPRHPVIPSTPQHGADHRRTLKMLLRPFTPHCSPTSVTHTPSPLHTQSAHSCRGQNDVSLATAIDKFHIWLLLSVEMTLLICMDLREPTFRYWWQMVTRISQSPGRVVVCCSVLFSVSVGLYLNCTVVEN